MSKRKSFGELWTVSWCLRQCYAETHSLVKLGIMNELKLFNFLGESGVDLSQVWCSAHVSRIQISKSKVLGHSLSESIDALVLLTIRLGLGSSHQIRLTSGYGIGSITNCEYLMQ